jgi:hypothetical protein
MSTTLLSRAHFERVRRMERRHSITLRRPVADEMRSIFSKYGDLEQVIHNSIDRLQVTQKFVSWNAVVWLVQWQYFGEEVPPAWVIRYCLKEPKFILTKKGWRNAVVSSLR